MHAPPKRAPTHKQNPVMSAPIAIFIAALVLAVIVVAWIAYCMFCRERPKAQVPYDISDLRQKNYEVAQKQNTEVKKKGLTAGIFILPSRHKHKDESYERRPDYPESPMPVLEPAAGQLVELFNESKLDADVQCKDGILEIDSYSHYHSEV